MKANELNIGNYIQEIHSEDIREVVSLSKQKVKDGFYFSVNGLLPEHIFPIPLTEEWLVKFGFEKKILNKTENTVIYSYFKPFPNSHDKKWGLTVIIDYTVPLISISNTWLTKKPLYVHTIQNIWFDLTDEELSLTES